MEEMINNKNIRKEIEKKAAKIAEEEKERYMREMQSLKNNKSSSSSSEDEEESIGPSINFKSEENSEDVTKSI